MAIIRYKDCKSLKQEIGYFVLAGAYAIGMASMISMGINRVIEGRKIAREKSGLVSNVAEGPNAEIRQMVVEREKERVEFIDYSETKMEVENGK